MPRVGTVTACRTAVPGTSSHRRALAGEQRADRTLHMLLACMLLLRAATAAPSAIVEKQLQAQRDARSEGKDIPPIARGLRNADAKLPVLDMDTTDTTSSCGTMWLVSAESKARNVFNPSAKAYSHGYMIDAEELYSVPNPENLV